MATALIAADIDLVSARHQQGHQQGVNDAAFSADSKYLASASDDRTIILWDVTTAKMLSTMRGPFVIAIPPYLCAR